MSMIEGDTFPLFRAEKDAQWVVGKKRFNLPVDTPSRYAIMTARALMSGSAMRLCALHFVSAALPRPIA